MTGWGNEPVSEAPDFVPTQTQQTGPFPARVSLTLKGDGAYDAPWYVIHGQDAADIRRQLEDPELTALLQAATNVSTNWSKHQSATKGLTPVASAAAQPAYQPAPTGAVSQNPAPANSGPAPSCEHGPREWKDFTSKAGNHVKGWFCTTRNSDCKPLYAK